MKTKINILAAILLLSFTANAQLFDRATGIEYKVNENSLSLKDFEKSKKWNYKRTALGCGVAFIGGASNGLNQVLLHHYPQFKKMHPGANDEYWNPEISWKRKYKDFDNGDLSERFFLSKNLLSGFTDALHPTQQLSNISLVGATCIVTIGEKRKWQEYAIDIIAISVARSIGFHGVYSLIYK